MDENTFVLDTQKSYKKNFLGRVKNAVSCATLFSGLFSVFGIVSFIAGIANRTWQDIGMASFVKQGILYVSVLCIFISLLKLLIDEQPFSGTLTWCIRIISVLYLAGSVVLPRLSGYRSSGFDLFSGKNFTLIDGSSLFLGLLLFVLSVLIREGFRMQTEIDEML
ncbi:MAG: DUF2975 domain-containing protein [Lachnospiraceae bacterium]|nr:DUF2975 domain-containing protein [Lachnospiraceae bacterium]